MTVHFQEIIDGEGETYTVVSNSEFSVARTATRGNTSDYYVNGRRVQAKDVVELLKAKGIDLDNNRFLILQARGPGCHSGTRVLVTPCSDCAPCLPPHGCCALCSCSRPPQGEVESISLMKPKAADKNETGLLEYLEVRAAAGAASGQEGGGGAARGRPRDPGPPHRVRGGGVLAGSYVCCPAQHPWAPRAAPARTSSARTTSCSPSRRRPRSEICAGRGLKACTGPQPSRAVRVCAAHGQAPRGEPLAAVPRRRLEEVTERRAAMANRVKLAEKEKEDLQARAPAVARGRAGLCSAWRPVCAAMPAVSLITSWWLAAAQAKADEAQQYVDKETAMLRCRIDASHLYGMKAQARGGGPGPLQMMGSGWGSGGGAGAGRSAQRGMQPACAKVRPHTGHAGRCPLHPHRPRPAGQHRHRGGADRRAGGHGGARARQGQGAGGGAEGRAEGARRCGEGARQERAGAARRAGGRACRDRLCQCAQVLHAGLAWQLRLETMRSGLLPAGRGRHRGGAQGLRAARRTEHRVTEAAAGQAQEAGGQDDQGRGGAGGARRGEAGQPALPRLAYRRVSARQVQDT